MPVSVPPTPSRPGEAQTKGWTTVKMVALLLAETGSMVEELTLAVLVKVVGVAGAVKVIATVIVLPRVITPSAQVTVEVPEQEPWVALAETKVAPAGIVSVNVPVVVLARPKFWTWMV